MKNGKNINLYSDPSLRNESNNLLEEGYQTLVTPRTQDKSKGKEKDNFQTVGKGLKKKKRYWVQDPISIFSIIRDLLQRIRGSITKKAQFLRQ